MPPPPKADARCPCRKPHPLSLVPLTDVFPDGTSEHAALRRDAPFVPPLAHRRGSASRPLEVRVRSTITSLTDVDFGKQTFTCTFFLDASWVRAHTSGSGALFAVRVLRACCARAARARSVHTRVLTLHAPSDRAAQMDYGLRGKAGAQSVNAELSDQRRGWLVTREDPAHYYFAPQLALANLEDGDLEETFEVSQDDSKPESPALVAFRVSGTGARAALLHAPCPG